MMKDMLRRERPVLVYDGDCGFCTSFIGFVERHIPTSAEIVAFQSTDLDALGTTKERAAYEALWVDRSGHVYGGAQAVAKLLMDAGGPWWVLGAIARIPPFRWLAHGIYRLIAGNRYRIPGGTTACGLPVRLRPGTAPES
jgi:predicted DCC family thiol-disulfide oxidoreductase YuxK